MNTKVRFFADMNPQNGRIVRRLRAKRGEEWQEGVV